MNILFFSYYDCRTMLMRIWLVAGVKFLLKIYQYLLHFPQMQNKIDSLQDELRQAKSSIHNHTFADAERSAEVCYFMRY